MALSQVSSLDLFIRAATGPRPANKAFSFTAPKLRAVSTVAFIANRGLEDGNSSHVAPWSAGAGESCGHAGRLGHLPRRGYRNRGHYRPPASENPPKYLVKLLFSFRGVDEVEVPEERIATKSG